MDEIKILLNVCALVFVLACGIIFYNESESCQKRGCFYEQNP